MITIKPSGTLKLQGLLEFDGTPVDITNWNIKSTLRRGNLVVGCFDVSIIDGPNGEFEMDIDTTGFKAGKLDFDVRFSFSGTVMYTQTGSVVVERAYTREGDCV